MTYTNVADYSNLNEEKYGYTYLKTANRVLLEETARILLCAARQFVSQFHNITLKFSLPSSLRVLFAHVPEYNLAIFPAHALSAWSPEDVFIWPRRVSSCL